MRNYIQSRVKTLVQRKPRTKSEFIELVNLVLSRVIMFNAKRGGEAGKMTIHNYRNPMVPDAREDFDLSKLESKLCDRYDLYNHYFDSNYLTVDDRQMVGRLVIS